MEFFFSKLSVSLYGIFILFKNKKKKYLDCYLGKIYKDSSTNSRGAFFLFISINKSNEHKYIIHCKNFY